MADEHKSKADQNAHRISQWLIEHRTEFEQQGINEDKVAAATGLSDIEAKEAIDHLESREEVVRMPQTLTTPPQFLLKPGRGWPEIRDHELEKRTSG